MTTKRGTFRKGQSGNPTGRPKGSRDRRTLALDSLLEGQAEALTQKAVDMALEGDTVALRLCLERLIPPRRERRLDIILPPIASPDDAVRANAALVAAVASGELTAGEAADMAKLVDNVTRAIETTDLAARITRLEEARKHEGA